MILNGKCAYVGQETKQSAKTGKNYTIVNFVDEKGKTFTCMSEQPLQVERFQSVNVAIDVIQGQYPKYTLVSYSK